jgi:hypothetical protein
MNREDAKNGGKTRIEKAKAFVVCCSFRLFPQFPRLRSSGRESRPNNDA